MQKEKDKTKKQTILAYILLGGKAAVKPLPINSVSKIRIRFQE